MRTCVNGCVSDSMGENRMGKNMHDWVDENRMGANRISANLRDWVGENRRFLDGSAGGQTCAVGGQHAVGGLHAVDLVGGLHAVDSLVGGLYAC